MGEWRSAAWYSDYYARHLLPGPELAAIHYESARLVIESGASWVIDYGCGPGWQAKVLHDLGFAGYYHGHDFSEHAIAVAKENRVSPKHEFYVTDIESGTHYTPQDPECVTMFVETLEHVKDDRAVFRSLVRPGARVIVSVPTYDAEAHVRVFNGLDDLMKRYGIDGRQFIRDRQIYVTGVVR